MSTCVPLTNGDKEAGMIPSTPSVRALVARYAEATADNRVFFHPDIPEHRLASALTAYPGIEAEDVLVLLDNTESGDATEGLLLTDDAIHACGSSGLVQRLPLTKLRNVGLATASPTVLRLNGIAVLDSIRVRPETMEGVVAMLREITVPSPNEADATRQEPDNEQAQPALWNPQGAAFLSLFFSPVFGACIHALNWKALGNQRLFRASLLWMLPGIALPFLAAFLLPLWAGITLGFGYFAAWYLLAGRAQVRHVKDALPRGYAPRPWLLPTGCALAWLAAVILVVGTVPRRNRERDENYRRLGTEFKERFSNRSLLEKEAVGLVTEILAENAEMFSRAPRCLRVRITEEIVDNHYRATATLDNGTDIALTIQDGFDGTITVRLSL
jgi:hypothetical protein